MIDTEIDAIVVSTDSDQELELLDQEEPVAPVLPVEEKKKRTQRSKKERKTKTEKKKEKIIQKQATFNIKTLIHYLNTCYGESFLFKDFDKIKEQSVTGKNVIDISNHTALNELKMIIKGFDMKDEKLTDKERWNLITHSIFDFELRGILTAINDNMLCPRDQTGDTEKTYDLLMDKIIPQLKFDAPYTFDKHEVKKAISSFLTSDKIKFKIFNQTFPHPELSIMSGKEQSHLNKLYLQNVSKFHTKFLKKLFSSKDQAESVDDLFDIVYDDFASNYSKEGITVEFLKNFDWANYKLMKFTKEQKSTILPVIKQVNLERNIAKKYFDFVKTCRDAGFKLQENVNEYNKLVLFASKLAKEVEQTELKNDDSVQDFIMMFVDVFRKINEPLNYGFVYNSFIKDIGFNKRLMFTQKFKQVLSLMIKNPETKVVFGYANTFECKDVAVKTKSKDGTERTVTKEFKGDVIQEQKYVPKTTYNTLSKIGLFVEEPNKRIRKDIKAGIGVSIVNFVRTQCDRMFTAKKHRKNVRKVVFIK